MHDTTKPLKVIHILADGQFHSGEDLAKYFNITRAAINKYIKQIRSWGVELESVRGKGYQLKAPLDLLVLQSVAYHYQQYYIQQQDPQKHSTHKYSKADLQLDLIPIIDSTNQYLLDNLNTLTSGAACVAEYQHAARGRRGRKWFAPFGCNLYLSMYWRLEQGPAAAMGLSLAMGIVIADVLRDLTQLDIKVKWPNDLYLNDRKLAGILVEIAAKTGDCAHIVLGMGINLLMNNPDQAVVNQSWANLGAINRNQLVAKLLLTLRQAFIQFEQQGLESFLARWNSLDNFYNRPVKLLIGDNVIKGINKGINQQGALLLEQDGIIQAYIGGEISLRADA